MKVPPKRKGNSVASWLSSGTLSGLNESPSEKEGKCVRSTRAFRVRRASMKVPPKRKGNDNARARCHWFVPASMKVPPKRKGNKLIRAARNLSKDKASMKVPPKRKGNGVEL